MNTLVRLIVCLIFVYAQPNFAQVVTDGDVVLESDEVAYAIRNLPQNLQADLFDDPGARYRVLARLVAGHKYEQAVKEKLTTLNDDGLKWQLQYDIQARFRKFLENEFQSDLVVPDLRELAEEEYRVNYAEIAKVPEKRQAAHILVACEDAECDESWVEERVARVQSEIARTDEFGLVARRMSDDRGSALNAGLLNTPIAADDEAVVTPFREALFALTEAGQTSEPILSSFGFHIIRLVEIFPARTRPFEEVAEGIMQILERRYRREKLIEYIDSFGPSDQLSIDESLLKRLIDENVPN